MSNGTTTNRLGYIDVLNVCATFAVVALHCNDCFWKGPAGASWVSASIIECLYYWAVPVFLMITGVTLLEYRRRMGTKDYLVRRARRTVIPWLFWSLVGLGYAVLLAKKHGQTLDLSPMAVVRGLLESTYVPPFWYFLELFGVYLSIPVLAAVKDKRSVFMYGAVVGTLLGVVLPFVCARFGWPWNGAIAPKVVSHYLLYVLIGWLIAQFPERTIPTWVSLLLFVGGFLIQCVGTFELSNLQVGVDKTFKGYMNLPAFMQSVGLFSLVRSIDFSQGAKKAFAERCKWLSGLTLGVYLSHWFVINMVGKMHVVDTSSLAWRVLGPILVFAVCIAFTWCAKKIPGLRKVMG